MKRLVLFAALLVLGLLMYPVASTQNLPGPTQETKKIYLPLALRNYSASSGGRLVQPADFQYMGAFLLPLGADKPLTFEYGGDAMTYNPSGDPSGPADGFPGSLFITGHSRQPETLNGDQVAELKIPLPVNLKDLAALNRAEFIQGFHDVAAGYFTQLNEIPRLGMQYLNHPATGPLIHLAWGQHFQFDENQASHAWFSPNLSTPGLRGTWFIGSQSLYSVNGYMLEIPAAWADANAQGRYLGTGRFKDGGMSGMGPALFAYKPWTDSSGAPAPAGAHLPETVLLLYEDSVDNDVIRNNLTGYQHPDEWEGAAWITTSSGKTGVLFAGTKSTGTKYWYGFINPAGPNLPCVFGEYVGQFPLCRYADGAPCPASDLVECAGHTSERGWWSTSMTARFILYNPADLAQVATGKMNSWTPQPYAYLDIDSRLFLNPAGIEPDMIGTGVQRRYRISDITYDRANGLLYVLELFADEARPVVHVWKIN